MSNEQLKHIFENSTCLTQKQMISYVSGNMTNEEAHAVETHLNSCAMCSDAIDGMFEQAKAQETLPAINADFLHPHLVNTGKQINLTTSIPTAVKKNNVQRLLRPMSLAAGLLLLVVSIWYYRMLQQDVSSPQIAQQLPSAQIEARTSEPQQQPIAMNEVAKENSTEPKAVTAVKTILAKDAMADEPTQDTPLASLCDGARLSNPNEDLEKMPTRQTNNVASTTATAPAMHPQTAYGNSYTPNKNESVSLSGARNEGAAYYVDGVKTLNKRATTAQKESEADKLQQADKLYEAKQYNDALNIYIRESKNEANDNDRRDEARIGAARCYIAVGDKVRAKAQLNAVTAKHGVHKREAKRLLREL